MDYSMTTKSVGTNYNESERRMLVNFDRIYGYCDVDILYPMVNKMSFHIPKSLNLNIYASNSIHSVGHLLLISNLWSKQQSDKLVTVLLWKSWHDKRFS